MTVALNIPQGIDASAVGQQFMREAQAFSQLPQLQVHVRPGAEAANVRRFTLQVVNRRGRDCIGLFALLVVIGTTETGGPGGSQTVSVVSGATVQTIASNQAYVVMTGANGKAEIDVTVTGAGTRYVRAGVLATMFGTEGAAWV